MTFRPTKNTVRKPCDGTFVSQQRAAGVNKSAFTVLDAVEIRRASIVSTGRRTRTRSAPAVRRSLMSVCAREKMKTIPEKDPVIASGGSAPSTSFTAAPFLRRHSGTLHNTHDTQHVLLRRAQLYVCTLNNTYCTYVVRAAATVARQRVALYSARIYARYHDGRQRKEKNKNKKTNAQWYTVCSATHVPTRNRAQHAME